MGYKQLLNAYREKHGYRFKEPRQGLNSLHPTLHLAFSLGIARGYYDVGTYANKPGDHGKYPAWAFDLRRKGWVAWIGWGRRNAQKLANFYWENHEALNINYVIVGDEVISRSKPYWHPLTTGDTSHRWHIHVSGTGKWESHH